MTILQSIEFFTAINLAITGLSHFLQPKIWVDFFVFLHSKANVGNIVNALISVGMGSFILSFHLVWDFPRILVTMYGFLLVLKGFLFLLIPSMGIKSIGSVTIKGAEKFRIVGLVMFLLAIGIVYGLVVEGAF
ncbi:MAG: hypothetical protein R3E32_02530 [Chitinophagales bacterium]